MAHFYSDTFLSINKENAISEAQSLMSGTFFQMDLTNRLLYLYNYMKWYHETYKDDTSDIALAIRNFIWQQNKGLVKSALKYIPKGYYDFAELSDIAIVHLPYIIDKFDFNKGYKFTTYAVRAMKNEMLGHINKFKQEKIMWNVFDNTTVNPKEVHGDNFTISDIKQLITKHMSPDTAEILSMRLEKGMTFEDIGRARETSKQSAHSTFNRCLKMCRQHIFNLGYTHV